MVAIINVDGPHQHFIKILMQAIIQTQSRLSLHVLLVTIYHIDQSNHHPPASSQNRVRGHLVVLFFYGTVGACTAAAVVCKAFCILAISPDGSGFLVPLLALLRPLAALPPLLAPPTVPRARPRANVLRNVQWMTKTRTGSIEG